MWDKIPEGKEKSADFYIEFEEVIFLFELKSGTMGIGSKTTGPGGGSDRKVLFKEH